MTTVTTLPTTYGYARVSGNTQDLSDQLAQLEAAGCSQIYREKITGTRADRPQFQAVLAQLTEGDTLVVTKLDRFARSAQDAISLVRDLMRRGVRIHILNMGVVENTTTGRLLLTILAGFAEFERDLIVERMAEGKAAARQRDDWREGRPRKYSRQQIEHAMALLGEYSYTEVERMTGISKATLVRRNRERKQKQAGVTP